MRRTPVILVLSLLAVVALAACSSDDNNSSSSTTPTTVKPAATGKAIVVAADVGGVGRVVVNANGQTVYTLTGPNGAALACQGPCLTAWPPVLVDSGLSDSGGAGVKDVSSTPGAGGKQVTINGLPVYTYSGDAKGQANGEGISSFGGTWHVVKISGSTSATTKPSTSTSGSGYGY